MATQDDIDLILDAIRNNAQEVRHADGRRVVYRSVTEMRDALAIFRAELDTDGDRTTFAEMGRE